MEKKHLLMSIVTVGQMSHQDYPEFLDDVINTAAFSISDRDDSSRALFPGALACCFHFTKMQILTEIFSKG